MKSFLKKLEEKVKKLLVRPVSRIKVNCEAIRKLYKNRRAAKNPLHEITGNDVGTNERGEIWMVYGETLKSDIHILTELKCFNTFLTKEERQLVSESANLILDHLENCWKDATLRRNPTLSMKELEEKTRESVRAEIAGKPSTLG